MTNKQVAGISKMSYAFGAMSGLLGQVAGYAPDDLMKAVQQEYSTVYDIWDDGLDMLSEGDYNGGVRSDGLRQL